VASVPDDSDFLDGAPEPRRSQNKKSISSKLDHLKNSAAAALRWAADLFRLSALTQRIIGINVLLLIVLLVGVLSLSQARETLIDAHKSALETQARNVASILAETGVVAIDGQQRLDRELVVPIVRRLIDPKKTHARVYDSRRRLMADSNLINDIIIQRELAPPGDSENNFNPFQRLYRLFTDYLAQNTYYPEAFSNDETKNLQLSIETGLSGLDFYTVTRNDAEELIVSYAVPVQPLEQVLGVLILEVSDIDEAIRAERVNLFRIFAIAIVVSLISSFVLAQTISKPVRQLAEAADTVRRASSERKEIPDMSRRSDEIGELGQSLRAMTSALFDRIDAIESFAADVAHEIKNPLTSLRSAVETFEIAKTDETRGRLLKVIQDDVSRIDRLISDISNASRLDAELARQRALPVNIRTLLTTIIDIYTATAKDGAPEVKLTCEESGNGALMVNGLEDSLGQVFRNLVDNAISFSPSGGTVRVRAWAEKRRRGQMVFVSVEDQGPGIPDENLTDVFERFYTSRPQAVEFGKHSGLGLAISKQIVEAHRGEIKAENIRDRSQSTEKNLGARFVVSLPALGD